MARNVSASFGDGTNTFATLSGGTGFFVLGDPDGSTNPLPAGIAGRLSGTVAVTIPGVELSGTFSLAINTLGSAVNSTMRFGPQPATTNALALGDVNGDQLPDLVIATEAKNILYLNDGSGDPYDLLSGIEIGGTTKSRGVALGDVDNDGDLDLVVANGDTDANELYLNDGTGVFTLDGDADLGTGGTAVAVGDVTGDDFADIVIGFAGAAPKLFKNQGLNGTEWQGYDAGTDLGAIVGTTSALVLANLDKLGRLDLIVGNDGGQTQVYLNSGTATPFSTTPSHTLGATTVATKAIAVADVDGDGFLDVVQGNDSAFNRVFLATTTTNGTVFSGFAAGTDLAGSDTTKTRALAALDVDGDGDLDLVEGNGDSTANNLYENLGVVSASWAGFEDPASIDGGAAESTTSLAVGDVDGDGNADVLVGNTGTDSRVLLGDGAGSLTRTGAIGAITLNVGQGPLLAISATGVFLTVLGQTLTIAEFNLTQVTLADGSRIVTVGVTNAKLTLTGLGEFMLNGNLVVTKAGMGAKFGVTANLQLGEGITVTGGLEIRINTAATPIVLNDGPKTQLPAGQYLRIEGKTVEIRIDVNDPSATTDDIVVGGSLVVEQTTNATGQKRTLLAFSGVKVSLGPDFPEVLKGASGVFLIQPTGIAGQLQGTVQLPSNLPFSLQGTFGFAINRTTVLVNESVTVGGQTLTLNLPVGPFTRIAGTGVRLVVAGQTLSGDFAIELSGTTKLITAKNVSISLGDGTTDVVRVTNGSGSFLIDPPGHPGIAGKLAATVALNIPGITLEGTLFLELNTTNAAVNGLDAGNYLRVGATNVKLGVAGQTLKGNFFFEQTTRKAADGTFTARVTRLAATNVSIFLGDDGGTPGETAQAIANDTGIFLKNGTAQLLITPAGIAGSFSVEFELRGLSSFLTLPAGATFSLKINTTTVAVNETFKVPDGADSGTDPDELVLQLPAGPFLRAELTLPAPGLTIFGQNITGASRSSASPAPARTRSSGPPTTRRSCGSPRRTSACSSAIRARPGPTTTSGSRSATAPRSSWSRRRASPAASARPRRSACCPATASARRSRSPSTTWRAPAARASPSTRRSWSAARR